MYIKGGLRFQKSGDDGLLVTVQDGVAENAPVLREVIFDRGCFAELLAEIGPVKKVAKKAAKKVKK